MSILSKLRFFETKMITYRKYKINNNITLKLEDGKTTIYIRKEKFLHCKFLFFTIPINGKDTNTSINSIDQASEIYNSSLEGIDSNGLSPEDFGLSPDQVFWAHCSNLQAWAENDYNPNLLHSNLAFPLLKKLSDAGDKKANDQLMSELEKRWINGSESSRRFLIEQEYLHYAPFDMILSYYDDILCENDASVLKTLTKELGLNHYNIWLPQKFNKNTIIDWWEKGSVSGAKIIIENRKVILLYAQSYKKNLIMSDAIFNLKNLQYLHLENIDFVPNKFNSLFNLKYLSLLDIGNFPFSIVDLKKLNFLSIEKIRDCFQFPSKIKGLKNLKNLKLLNLKIENLPNSIVKLENLEIVDLRGTNITFFPSFFSEMKNLKKIIFSNNIQDAPNSFKKKQKYGLEIFEKN